MARFSIDFCDDSDRELGVLTAARGVKSKAEAGRLFIDNAEQQPRRERITL